MGCTTLPLIEEVRLERGDSVLVNGAKDVGSMVVQLAKNAAGESRMVVGKCSGEECGAREKAGNG